MAIEYFKRLNQESLQKEFRNYLVSLNCTPDIASKKAFDALLLWRKKDKNFFWAVVTSENFCEEAPSKIQDVLKDDSPNVALNYYSTLRILRECVYEESNEEALKRFLLDVKCLDKLSKWTNRFNLFDVLDITKAEIKHSNMLAWLMTPTENHGFNDSILLGFIQFCVSNGAIKQDKIFDVLTTNYYEFEIKREWNNIDTLAVSEKNKFIVCIENKNIGEHDNQLSRYRAIVMSKYPNYIYAYLFLTPNGAYVSDNAWTPISYKDVLDIIEMVKTRHANLIEFERCTEQKVLIDNYVEIIRRKIAGDEELEKVCAEIYKKHKKALDLIFENKPDRTSMLSIIIREWAKDKTERGVSKVNLDKCINSFTRFTTDAMSSVLPEGGELGDWGTDNHYFYEVKVVPDNNSQKEKFRISLAISSKNLSEESRRVVDKIQEIEPTMKKKQNWEWHTHLSTDWEKVVEESSEESIFKKLDKMLDEIKQKEAKLIKKLESALEFCS